MKLIEQRALRTLLKTPRFSFSKLSTRRADDLTRFDHMQFSKKRLTDFGDLPAGQIPEALRYSKPVFQKTLSNGITAVAETWNQPLAAITITVKAGSRNETLENSGVSNFISRLLTKGTTDTSKSELLERIHSFGGYINTNICRETASVTITYLKEHTQAVVKLLGQIYRSASFNQDDLEAEKGAVIKEAQSTDDPKKIIIDGSLYTSFRDHMLGQPAQGIKDNIPNITQNHLKEFVDNFYVGENITVSGAGNINFNEFTGYVQQSFGKIRRSGRSENVPNSQQPFFTPSLMFMRDDEITNMSSGISWRAPGWTDPDYLGINFIKYIIGEYRVDKYTGAHLNAAHLQYNNMHSALGEYPDIIWQQPFYNAYSDTGIWGNFMHGNEMHNYQLLLLGQAIISELGARTEQPEVFRARAKYWNELLDTHCATRTSLKNAKQGAYLGRILTRTELATKISHMDAEYVRKIAAKWFWDTEISVVAYGPLHRSAVRALHNRLFRRSTLGSWGAAQSRFV